MNGKSDYHLIIPKDQHIIVIIDKDLGGLSVTNDIDNIIDYISSNRLNLNNYIVIYRDSEGLYERVYTKDGKYIGQGAIDPHDLLDRMFLDQSG